MSDKMHLLSCNSVDELVRCAKMPLSAYPTTQAAMRNLEFPLDNIDYNELSANEINLFSATQPQATSQRVAYSSNMSGPTFTVDNPFICTGVCVILQGEPVSTQIEGNQMGPRAVLDALTTNPASPLNLRNVAALQAALFGNAAQLPDGFFGCPSVLDWGGSTWRFIWAVLQAWRLVFECPNSGFENIIDERLADIGNCCPHTNWQGFGDSDHPLMYLTRRMNARLNSMTQPTELASPADGYSPVAESGYFFPVNSEQNEAGEITPYHYLKEKAAYGCPFQTSQYEMWIRLPIPMPLDPNTKIKLTLNRRAGDEDYWYRSLDEGILRRCVGPNPNSATVGCNFPINEAEQAAQDAGGIACQTIIPGGQVRFGLGLKGFQVREGTCHLWRRVLQDKEILMQLLHDNYMPMGGAGSCGSPIQTELVNRYRDEGALMKKVGVPAGFVGQPDEG